MDQGAIGEAQVVSNALGKLRTAVVEEPGKNQSEHGNAHRSSCQFTLQGLFRFGILRSLRLGAEIFRRARWFRTGMEDRSQELVKAVMSAERFGNANPSHDNGTQRQHNQGSEHDPRTFVYVSAVTVISMSMGAGLGGLHARLMTRIRPSRTRSVDSARRLFVLVVYRLASLAEERHEPEPEHVERGHAGGDPADEPEDPASVGLVR